MNYLNVESLLDIVNSQIILFGNCPVFLNSEKHNQDCLSIFADGQEIIEAVFACKTNPEQFGLEVIEKRLEKLNPNSIIEYWPASEINCEFALGFIAEDRFVEVMHSQELKPRLS
ncbi:TPA: hypothetical protein I6W77_003219 [Vibrio cholerae]|uniref:hypothetical protein n=1 Tax=Vibrio cholerae TaxID=666 RepID=UPI001658411D|nr:hypothetical protein [Vibrio cholerae]EGR0592960.1 hypothetical protein [Vibrio cholerae]MBC9069463.1 hypothetical protein [Vibrio cholerae]HAS2628728.1 hypothetical protein [Vibrio cholerae]HAS2771667.1 hypothetical protein [Vibrio cholerae]HAS4509725.1 hypothetical protein [Vibrio cholerae]